MIKKICIDNRSNVKIIDRREKKINKNDDKQNK